jgi:hypothetical protein
VTERSTPISDPGLCRDCRHSRRIESDRGSIFWQCQLSFSDKRFPKYPRLPVRQCDGYERGSNSGDTSADPQKNRPGDEKT